MKGSKQFHFPFFMLLLAMCSFLSAAEQLNGRSLMNVTADTVQAEVALLQTKTLSLMHALDSMWIFTTAVGIVSMQVGFVVLEAGTVQVKNVRTVVMKNLMDSLFGAMVWYAVGFGIYLGGGENFFLTDSERFGLFVQQYGFAITSVTIVSGGVCSRMKFGRYSAFTVIQMAIVYPLAAHVSWVEGGFLYDQGFIDFAGSGVIHTLGGIAGLVGAFFLGPRAGRFYPNDDDDISAAKKYEVRPLLEHNSVLVTLGGLMLFMGWFPFNASSGSNISQPEDLVFAARGMISTLLAGSAAGTMVTVYRMWFNPVQDIQTTINGILAGLVAVTASCANIDPWAALVIGFGAGPVYLFTSYTVLYRFHIDDPLNVFAVHAASGIYGVLMAGVFDLDGGIVYGKGIDQFLVQLEGIAVLSAWSLVTSAVAFGTIGRLFGLRASEHDQLVGLDLLYHRKNAYPESDLTASRQAQYTRAAKELLHRRNNNRGYLDDSSIHSGRTSVHSTRAGAGSQRFVVNNANLTAKAIEE